MRKPIRNPFQPLAITGVDHLAGDKPLSPLPFLSDENSRKRHVFRTKICSLNANHGLVIKRCLDRALESFTRGPEPFKPRTVHLSAPVGFRH